MEITKGLLYINDKDAAQEWGVFLTEKKEGEWTNYEALLKPSTTKELTVVDNPDADGEELPEEIDLHLQARRGAVLLPMGRVGAGVLRELRQVLHDAADGQGRMAGGEAAGDRPHVQTAVSGGNGDGATDPDRRRRRVQQDEAEIQGAEASVLKRRLQGIQTTIKQR